MRRIPVRRILPAAAVVLLVAAGVFYLTSISGSAAGPLRASGTIESIEVGVASEVAGRVSEILVDEGYCTEDQVMECLAAEYGVPYAKLETRLFDLKTLELLPREFIERNYVLPLFCIRDVLTVAVSELSNMFLIDEIRATAGKDVQIVAASSRDIRRMITQLPDSKVFVNIGSYGNTSAATIAVALTEALEEGRVSPGDVIVFAAFGAGLSWAAAVLRWGDRTTPLGTSDAELPPSDKDAFDLLQPNLEFYGRPELPRDQ